MASYCSQDCGVAYFKTRHWWCTKLPPVDGFALRTHKSDIPDICSPSCLCSPWHSWHTFYSWHIVFHSSCLFTTKDLQNIAENMHYTMSHFVFWFALHILPRSCHRSFGIVIVHYKWKKKISSILLLNYLNVFQFVKYLHISLFIDGFKGVSSTTIGYFLIRQTEFGGFAH